MLLFLYNCLLTDGTVSPGKVYQRFPELDWPNAPFNAKLPTVCV